MPEIDVNPDQAHDFIRSVGRDAAALEAQLERKADDRDAQTQAADQDPESWLTASNWSVDFLDKKFCPNWKLDAGEKQQLSNSLAEVLDLYFPGAMTGFDHWHPLAKLFGSVMMISAMRIDFETWQLAALHQPKKADDESASRRRTLDLGDGDDSERENSGRFTTHGE